MDYHCVTFTYKCKQFCELWTRGVFARSFICKDPVQVHLIQLPFGILVQSTYANIANALTGHFCLSNLESVALGSMTLLSRCKKMGKWTLSRHKFIRISDVGLGYTHPRAAPDFGA